MNTKKIILLSCLCLTYYSSLTGKIRDKTLDDGIISFIKKDITSISIGAYTFCIKELSYVLQEDTALIPVFCQNISNRLSYIKKDKDIYLTELMKIHFFEDSLKSHYFKNKEPHLIKIIDYLEKTPRNTLQKKDIHLFFESLTSESGVGADKIETLFMTQDLQAVFNFIQNDKNAKERFFRWIDEDIEVFCPAFGSGQKKWDDRIVEYLYYRLHQVNNPLTHPAIDKLKSWFEF
jgi:hypothetical protein